MSNPNDDWLATLFTDTLNGINKFIVETIETANKFAIENRHILFPLFNKGVDLAAQYTKNQARLWYNTQNAFYNTSKKYFINSIPYYPFINPYWINIRT